MDVKGVGTWMVRAGEGLEEEIRMAEEVGLGKYEMGRTLGEGKFGKVKYAKNLDSGQPFAVKILEKSKTLDLNISDQTALQH
ncbi:CBL-interacting serine/threonine-protein kinase 1 [Sarracenia purpurea var. burkii]